MAMIDDPSGYDGKAEAIKMRRCGEELSDSDSLMQEAEAEFEAELDREAEEVSLNQGIEGRFGSVLAENFALKDDTYVDGLRETWNLQNELLERNMAREVIAPKTEAHSEVYLGSIGAFETAPYDAPWSSGGVRQAGGSPIRSASSTTGELNTTFRLRGKGASAWASAAVGVVLYPSTRSGYLTFRSSPSYNYLIQTVSTWATSRASVWLGLYCAEYDRDSRSFVATKTSQKKVLDSLDTWWVGSSRQGRSSDYELSTGFQVTNTRYYWLWVWCGLNLYTQNPPNEAFDLFDNSAFANLSVGVDSMQWAIH
ncbi:MAG: hypothetical protein AAGI72_06420 [Pseudomonadota bacterium]